MRKEYVKKAEGAYRVGETRVSLDSLVCLFREGMSAESMVDSYPALTLEQVHGALAFLPREPERNRCIPCRRSARRGGPTPAVQTNECRIDCEAPTGAQCESNSRLTRDLDGRVLRGLRRAAPENRYPHSDGRRSCRFGRSRSFADRRADSVRILVSQDRRTMPAHFARFTSDAQSPGVILLRESDSHLERDRRSRSNLERQRS